MGSSLDAVIAAELGRNTVSPGACRPGAYTLILLRTRNKRTGEPALIRDRDAEYNFFKTRRYGDKSGICLAGCNAGLALEASVSDNRSHYTSTQPGFGLDMYVCICNAVTDRDIRQCAELGVSSLEDLRHSLGVANCCGKCAHAASRILAERTEPTELQAA
jgi:bacterioferritin-associated ferredoxin